MNMKPTKFDGILVVSILTVACLCLGLAFLVRPAEDTTLVAVITIDGAEYARLPLATDTTIALPTGHTVVVQEREVSVTAAPCPDQICVDTPGAHAVGATIVCLPEKVVITVTENPPAEDFTAEDTGT